MSISHSVADLEAWLQGMADEYFRANPTIDRAWYRPTTDFHPEEASFLRALEREVLVLDHTNGTCRFPDLNMRTGNPTCPKNYFHSKPETARRTREVSFQWREFLTQVAALTELLVDLHWPKNFVAFDPDSKGKWAFDLAVFETEDAIVPWLLAAETKSARSVGELDTLRRELLHWIEVREGPLEQDDSKSAKAFRELGRHRPQFFWLRAPGRSEMLKATYGPRGLNGLTPTDFVPFAR